nr:hypothetical protein [uncultured Alistipes sp.]
MTRRSKTIVQQCKYYDVDNIFEYMIETYVNGNISTLQKLYKELRLEARKEFVRYISLEENSQYTQGIIVAIM